METNKHGEASMNPTIGVHCWLKDAKLRDKYTERDVTITSFLPIQQWVEKYTVESGYLPMKEEPGYYARNHQGNIIAIPQSRLEGGVTQLIAGWQFEDVGGGVLLPVYTPPKLGVKFDVDSVGFTSGMVEARNSVRALGLQADMLNVYENLCTLATEARKRYETAHNDARDAALQTVRMSASQSLPEEAFQDSGLWEIELQARIADAWEWVANELDLAAGMALTSLDGANDESQEQTLAEV